ncbi:aldo/keto reductase [Maricaulaceae bacterium MS644]
MTHNAKITRKSAVDVQGASIPKLGFGTWKLKDGDAYDGVKAALETGYRHIDTAQAYGNEGEVGRAIADSGVAREDIFLTTKVWMERFTAGDLEASVKESLSRLKVDKVDLLLLHWPQTDVPLSETLNALNACRDGGMAAHIGVSNFTTTWLGEAVALSKAPLICNQVEYHPFLDQTPVLDAVEKYDMALTAYSPIAQGEVLDDSGLKEIAKTHDKTPVQVALRWLIQQERVCAIPRSSSNAHVESNFEVFDFELSEQEMGRIHDLRSRNHRIVDPDWAPDWDVAA